MFGNNREDDLLSKLKSCIGSLKTENSTVLPTKTPVSSHNYNAIKENYRNPSITPPVATSSNGNNGMVKNSLYPPHPYPERQPLATSNHPPITYPAPTYNYPQPPRHELPPNPNRYEQEVRPRTKVEDYRSSETTPRKFDYGFQPRRAERVERVEREERKGSEHGLGAGMVMGADHSSRSRQDIRSQISRRYSLMQNDRTSYKQPEIPLPITTPTLPTKSRTYQQQVQQRRELLQPSDRRERTPQVGKDYSGSIRKESYTSRESGRIKPRESVPPASVPVHSARKPDRPLMVAETLQRAYEEEGASSSECSALAKLRKISELNEKINDRIRNIINVFEEHKR